MKNNIYIKKIKNKFKNWTDNFVFWNIAFMLFMITTYGLTYLNDTLEIKLKIFYFVAAIIMLFIKWKYVPKWFTTLLLILSTWFLINIGKAIGTIESDAGLVHIQYKTVFYGLIFEMIIFQINLTNEATTKALIKNLIVNYSKRLLIVFLFLVWISAIEVFLLPYFI